MSKLKLAKNMLENNRALKFQLENMMHELEDVLNNSSTIDKFTLIDYQETLRKYAEVIKRRYGNNGDENSHDKFLMPESIPSNIEQGNIIWVNYFGMQKLMEGSNIHKGNLELKIVGSDIFSRWIGDLEVVGIRNGTAYVQPILNLDRISKLNIHYRKNEHRPVVGGELFWTNFDPHPVDNGPDVKSYHQPSRVSEATKSRYLVKVEGFVIFVDGISDKVYSDKKKPYDFVYKGTNESSKSGRAVYVGNSIRKNVLEIVNEYKQKGDVNIWKNILNH